MSHWLSRLRLWAATSGAPLLLAAAIVLPAALTWAALDLSYSSALAGRNAEIARLNAQLATYRDALGGAEAAQAAGVILSLREQTAAATRELAELQTPDREPNAVYQHARRIGSADGVEIDAANRTVAFQRMTLEREFDQGTNFEFRDLVLGFTGYAAVTRVAQRTGAIYHGPRFALVGHRGEGCARPPAADSARP